MARNAARQKVPRKPGPLMVPRRGEILGTMLSLSTVSADGSYPRAIQENVRQDIYLIGPTPEHALRELMPMSASLEWDSKDEDTSRMIMMLAENLCKSNIFLEPRPTAEDAERMAHVQLLLTCTGGPVEVEQGLPLSLVQVVASLLRWRLAVLRLDHEGESTRFLNKKAAGSAFDMAALRQRLEEAIQATLEKPSLYRAASGLIGALLSRKVHVPKYGEVLL